MEKNEQSDNKPVEQTKTPENDSDVSKMLDEISKSLTLDKEAIQKEIEEKLKIEYDKKAGDKDKEIKALTDKVNKLDEVYKKSVEEVLGKYQENIKTQFSKIEAELSKRQSVVPTENNPFNKVKKEDGKIDPEWYKRTDMTDNEKAQFFVEHCLKR